MVRKQACKIDCIFSVICLMTTIITDVKSSQTVLDQNDIFLLVNIVVDRVMTDQNFMIGSGSKDEG